MTEMAISSLTISFLSEMAISSLTISYLSEMAISFLTISYWSEMAISSLTVLRHSMGLLHPVIASLITSFFVKDGNIIEISEIHL